MTKRSFPVFILQISAAIVTLVIGLFNINKEVRPVVQKHLYQNKSTTWQWIPKGYDNYYHYYSDSTGTFWCRVNHQGVCEYATNPNQVANNTQSIIR